MIQESAAATARRWRISPKWLALGGVVAACLGYLLFSVTGATAEYYETIPELRAHPAASNVRVLGTVQRVLAEAPDGRSVRFVASDAGDRMTVSYQGTVPEIFRPGIQVVVQGHLGANGVFQASQLETKCPAHFSAASGGG